MTQVVDLIILKRRTFGIFILRDMTSQINSRPNSQKVIPALHEGHFIINSVFLSGKLFLMEEFAF